MPETKKNLPDLSGFHGADTVYKYGLVRGVVYTQGVKFLADEAGAYWLLDKIATLQMLPQIRREPMQFWHLKVAADESARLICEHDTDVVIYEEKIEWTDFPAEGIQLYAVWAEACCIMLPSEY